MGIKKVEKIEVLGFVDELNRRRKILDDFDKRIADIYIPKVESQDKGVVVARNKSK